MNKIINLINEINEDQSDIYASFPTVVSSDGFDLSDYQEQKSDFTGVDFEYVNQTGCADYGFRGTMAVPIGDFLIVWNYSE